MNTDKKILEYLDRADRYISLATCTAMRRRPPSM